MKRNNYIYPQDMFDCINRLQYSSLCKINGVLTLSNSPRSGDFDMPLSNLPCFSTQPGHGVVGMSWIGTLLISPCITIYPFLKRWNMLLHTKLNNSNAQEYTHDL